MKEKEFVDRYLTGKTWGWQELISSGRAPLKELENGNLKYVMEKFLEAQCDIEDQLAKLDYEAG